MGSSLIVPDHKSPFSSASNSNVVVSRCRSRCEIFPKVMLAKWELIFLLAATNYAVLSCVQLEPDVVDVVLAWGVQF